MVATLEDERASTFPDNETIAIPIKRARRGFRAVVRRACRIESVEDSCLGGAQLFGAAGNHNVLRTITNRLECIADSLTTRGAGAGRREYTTLEPEKYADVD